MTWLLDLYETYEMNKDQVGEVETNFFNTEFTLLPESHTYQTAQIELRVTPDGRFHSAEVLEKGLGNTVIPCSIDSANRTSAPIPHALHDSLQYVAGDFEAYGGCYKKDTQPHLDYLKRLKAWCESPYSNERVQSIYTYIKQGTLIEDLVAASVLHEQNHKLITKWDKQLEESRGSKPEIFKSVTGEQLKAFVRFDVRDPNGNSPRVWEDKAIYQSYIDYFSSQIKEEALCYITGQSVPATDKHASRLRYGGDMAKLISGNDSSGYTYRGRFFDKDQVATIGYEVSQKGHSALKWLITKQGKAIDGRVFLTWAMEKVAIPRAEDSSWDIFEEFNEPTEVDEVIDTGEYFAAMFNRSLDGIKSDLSYQANIYVMILDAATPGRMGITYYQSIDKDLYLERLKKWHQTVNWRHSYVKRGDKRITFYGAPAHRDIALAAFGTNANEKLIKNTVERLISCVVDGRKIPVDIVNNLVNRVSNPFSMEKWEWEKNLSITCAILKKHFEEEEYSVALDKTSSDRSYLFGRMLAVADVIENRVLFAEGDNRATSAVRYMSQFSKHPLSTWATIQQNLIPYQIKLRERGNYFKGILDEIGATFNFEEYSDEPLNGKFLLGYYSQRFDLYQKKSKQEEE